MKAKLKGKSGIKGLFLLHGEKIAIVLVGALAGWFLYKSASLPRLEDRYQATELQRAVSSTNDAVRNATWPAADSENAADVRVFKPIVKNAAVPVDASKYSLTTTLQPDVLPKTQLRTDPEILPAIEVVAVGGTGLLAFQDEKTRTERERRRQLEEEEALQEQEAAAAQPAEDLEAQSRRRGRGDEPGFETVFDPDNPTRKGIQVGGSQTGVMLQGGERIERAYWATVLAKVPIREQLKRNQDAFENARGGFNPTTDFPRYLGYIVERSEIVGGKAGEWTRVPVLDGQAKTRIKPLGKLVRDSVLELLYATAAKDWAVMTPELVDPRYIDPMLTLPLPPMVGRSFGADATHPDIPLAIETMMLEQPLEPEATPENIEQPAEEEDELSFRTTQGAATGNAFSAQPMMTPGFSHAPREVDSGAYSMSREGASAPMAGAGFSGSGVARELPRGVDYWLVRFFDFTVEPGKKYKYRVQLIVADPNYNDGTITSMLDPTVLDRQEKIAQKRQDKRVPMFILAETSEPSSTVGIPLGGSVRVASAKLPTGKGHYEEPVVKLWAEKFEPDEEAIAIRIAKEKEYARGFVVNLREKMDYADINLQWRDTFKDGHALYTNATVLDVDGAGALTNKRMAPSRVLMMDAAGELAIRDEMDDSLPVLELRQIFDDKRPRPGEEMIGPGGEFPGGRGGRGR